MGKKDFILDFSLVKTDKPLPCSREAVYLEAVITNFPVDLEPLNSFGQTALVNKGDRSAPLYKINRIDLLAPRPEKKQPVSGQGEHIIDLLPTDHVESNHPDIRKKASEIISDTETPAEKVWQLVDWVSRNVKDEAIENFSALDVLKERRGECQSHTLLYIAMARAAGIPSRFVGGIVYLEGTGFLYHGWAESDLDGWVPVDPTLNQVGVDATHIKLVDGSDWTSLLPLGDFVGHIGIRINDYRSLCNP
jgi:transglutaminase-like putative cysteine protease